jgi:hypothetical protein
MKVSIIYFNIWAIRSRRMRLVGHAAHVEEKHNAYGVFLKETGRKEITWKK